MVSKSREGQIREVLVRARSADCHDRLERPNQKLLMTLHPGGASTGLGHNSMLIMIEAQGRARDPGSCGARPSGGELDRGRDRGAGSVQLRAGETQPGGCLADRVSQLVPGRNRSQPGDLARVNLGTPDDDTAAAMHLAAAGARLSGTPWVLDPVGAGSSLSTPTAPAAPFPRRWRPCDRNGIPGSKPHWTPRPISRRRCPPRTCWRSATARVATERSTTSIRPGTTEDERCRKIALAPRSRKDRPKAANLQSICATSPTGRTLKAC